MRLELVSDNEFVVFINSLYFPIDEGLDKQNLSRTIKSLLSKLDKNYNLSLKGYYKVSIYHNKKIGSYLVLEKLEDFIIDVTTIDLRVIAYLNEEFLLEFDDYEKIPLGKSIFYLNNMYYLSVNDVSDEEILSLCDWSRIVYGDVVSNIKRVGKKLKTIAL